MGNVNPIRALRDYSKPSHEGYKNTIELLLGNNVVPLRSDTIRLVQNGCSFHSLRSEHPNQHVKNFLKLIDSLDFDGENRERTCLRLLKFSLRDQASNWLEHEAKGERNVKTNTTEYEDHEMTMESEEEFEEETKKEIEEEEEDTPKHFDTFPTMKESRCHEWLLKNLDPHGLHYNYHEQKECDFMVLEDMTSVIDHDLWSFVFGKLFVEATRLVYDREEGTIMFEKDKEKIVFKMPHKMEMFKHIDFTDIKTNCIPPFVIESDNDSSKRTHYSDILYLGPEYKHDENVCRAI
nr:MAK10-like protein [Tanacetum cinerariifolium]